MENKYYKPCRLSLQEQNRIIQLYTKNHLSITQIAKQTCHKSSTISKVLHNHDIEVIIGLRKYQPTEEEINKVREIIEAHGSYIEASKAINRDITIVKRIVEENNFSYDYRPYNKNMRHDFFKVIDCPEKAWLLGFLFTDGSVRQVGNSFQIRLSIQREDENMIEEIRRWLNLDNKILHDIRPGKECSGIEFTSKEIFEDLSNYGIVPNKTYLTNSLFIDKIPEAFRRDYIRGVFDGDGGLSFTGNVYEIDCNFTSHFYETVQEFQAYIDKQIGKTNHNKIQEFPGKCRCSWRGRQQVLKILSWLYDNSKVYLKRKYDKYLWIKSTV